jgi:hypothetical protein
MSHGFIRKFSGLFPAVFFPSGQVSALFFRVSVFFAFFYGQNTA